ncbi:hypothetical protein EDD22DRAFT_983371 [Suillus occidentalis]|nr:hypothetical protein EDD22DRAFT_983371 [Suillus occidentalis]
MAYNLYASWKTLIPTLVDAHLKYSARTHGRPLPELCPVISACANSGFLIHHGLFPTAPSQPHMAISVELLTFYWALFERSCDTIHALASALKTHYACRGFQMINAAGQVIQEPFRHGLGQAVQWYDILQNEVEQQTEAAVQISRERVYEAQRPQWQCASILMQLCPACFRGVSFGRPLSEGRDIHVVDNVGSRILTQRKHPPKIRASLVLDEAIDQCKHSYEAADGKKQKAAMDSFDDMGIMALICCHDIPLFFANIDSPGEQQKYAISLIEHLFSLLPQEATVVTLYDVGCVLSRSLSQYDILPHSVTSRLRFATTAMHAYGHEWACQLEYNPRMCTGLGLTDGEGTERLWSRFVKLIGIQRSSSRQRCLWLIDWQAGAIGLEMRTDLADWIKRHLKRGVNGQGATAKEVLNNCGIETQDLRDQWADQKKSQLSIHAHAPARLKKELDVVLTLQADLDASEKALQVTRTVVEKGTNTDETLDALESLERSHDRLMNKVEVLYASLNVQDRFPELQGIDLDFRAIGSFFEWDKLDRAVGGANQALGMKLHQQTRKAIAKRQPALMTAIRKFNSYCKRLESLFDPSWGVPLPAPLPTKLADLRNDQTLMEDVWITPSVGDVPPLLKQDRCREEQCCLGLEADNLCQWFRDELTALELAIRSPTNHPFSFPLQQWRDHILQLQTKWVTPLVSSIRFATNASIAVKLAITLSESKGPSETTIYDLIPMSLALPDPSLEDDTGEDFFAPEEAPEEAALSDILPDSTVSDDEEDIVGKPEYTICWQLPEVSQDGFPLQVFEPRDMSLLARPTARLNDVCINSCAALLYSKMLKSSHFRPCAILSTHDLPHIRYNAVDDVLWRNTSWTSFWEKDTCILPIHRPSPVGHWDIMNLIARLSSIAHQRRGSDYRDLKGWVAQPLIDHPLQTNGYDCGLWVLAAIVAVLRGAHRPGMREEDMVAFRHYVHTLVVRVPTA